MAKATSVAKLRVLVGQRVRHLRRRRGLSLEALGERAKMDAKFLQAIEVARQAATVDTIEKIAVGLGVQAAELFTFSEEKPSEARARVAKLFDAVSDEDVRKIARVLEALVAP